MLRRILVFFSTVLAALPLALYAAVPDVAHRTSSEQVAPAWVAENVALIDGQVEPRWFSPGVMVGLTSRIDNAVRNADSADESGCSTYSEPASPEPGRFKGLTVEEVLDNASEIYAGRVTDSRQGFLHGRPGTLVEIQLDNDHGAPPRTSTAPVIYAFLRIAKIEVEGGYLCSGRTENRPPPGRGRSAVLTLDGPLDESRILARSPDGHPIIQPMGYEIFFEDALGKNAAYGRHKRDAIDPSKLRAAAQSHGSDRQ